MSDKTLVIGGRSGIGRATAELLSASQKVEAPQRTELDVTDRCLIREYMDNRGPFDNIVYSAGVNELRWIVDYPHRDIMAEIYAVNVFGFVNVVSEHAKMFPTFAFSVVAVSSDAARIPMRGSLAYCSSKAALNAAIRVMARELAPNVRVNGVAPGMVEDTDMTRYIDRTVPMFRGWAPDYAERYERMNIPTHRRATLSEVAETISWVLTGPDQMTGAIIDINGGR